MQPNQRAVEEAKAYTEKPRGASDTCPRFALRSEAGSRERTIASPSQYKAQAPFNVKVRC